MAISPDLQAALDKAEASKDVALAADASHDTKKSAADAAAREEQDALSVSLASHKTATEDAAALIDAVKKEFGLT